MWKICRGILRNLANWLTEFGKLAHGIWRNLPRKTVVANENIIRNRSQTVPIEQVAQIEWVV